MIYIKWFLLTMFKLLVLLPSLLIMPQIIAAFTRFEVDNDRHDYTWGGWWGTHDNPPQGDRGFIAKHSFFPTITTGFKGYINRVQWMWRNKVYGFNKYSSIPYDAADEVVFTGNPDISDKDKVAGKYLFKLYSNGKLKAFEFYCVIPYSAARDIRCRIGWKMATRKFADYGFAQLVNTCNPFDGYGET